MALDKVVCWLNNITPLLMLNCLPNGSNNLEYNLHIMFIFPKEQVLTFNQDKCKPLALCFGLVIFH